MDENADKMQLNETLDENADKMALNETLDELSDKMALNEMMREKTADPIWEEHIQKEAAKKKMGIGKILLSIIAAIIATIAIAAGVFLFSPGLQMKVMTEYVMRNLRNYNWEGLQMEDPVKSGLYEALGQDKDESVETLYSFMKDSASKITWKLSEIDKENRTSTVDVTYEGAGTFVEEYANNLGDYIVKRLDDGSLKVEDLMNILTVMPDEDNAGLMKDALEKSGESEPVKVETQMTINFDKEARICIPTGSSSEVNDIATSGLLGNMEGIVDDVAKRMIPQIVELVFKSIKEFDQEKIESYAGAKLSEIMGIKENSQMYATLINYLTSCNEQLVYQVGEYDEENRSISVECSYLNSHKVITQFLKYCTIYAIQHFRYPIPTQEICNTYMIASIEEAKDDRLEETVTITFDEKDYSKFEISDNLANVVSANLGTELKTLGKFMP